MDSPSSTSTGPSSLPRSFKASRDADVRFVAEFDPLLFDLRQDRVDRVGRLNVQRELLIEVFITQQARFAVPLDDLLDVLFELGR